jgi:phosphoenolpyruvate carboxykinase (ATP)
VSERVSSHGLDAQGISSGATLHWNLGTAPLVEQAVARGEGRLTSHGALLVDTGKFTGRSVKDKYIVRDAATENTINWGAINQPMEGEHWANLKADFMAAVAGQDELFIADLFGGSQPEYRVNVRVINQMAWHNLFIRTLLVRPTTDQLSGFVPEYTIINLPSFKADPVRHGCRSDTVIAVNFSEKLILIGNTEYSGEMKKGVFGLLNFLLPAQGVMPMHCSANIGADGKSAIFFGLSGTGKTTLSSDPKRPLIGDDEHGWSDEGVFNFEGGCYAKVIDLSKTAEPEIWAATHRFGSVLENVVADARGRLDLSDQRYTENTRSCYPVEFIPNFVPSGRGGIPRNVMMLACDAFGVLPPIAKLSSAQAMYHFLSGYTALVAGTEKGLGAEPQPSFSACFGAPFLPRRPELYGRMLADMIAKYGADCWLVNTGWSGGAYGTGSRMSIRHTRALLNAALDGSLARVEFRQEKFFGLQIPTAVPGIPSEVLDPRAAWADKAAYDAQATKLVGMFEKNFKQFETHVGADVMAVALRAA